MTDIQAVFESQLSKIFKLEDEQRYEEIIQILDEIWLGNSEEDTEGWLRKTINFYKANIYLKLKKSTEALNYYKKIEELITIDQLVDWILLKRGIATCYIQMGRMDEARFILEKLLEIDFPGGNIASGFAVLKFYFEEALGSPKVPQKAPDIVKSYASYFGVELKETITENNIRDFIELLFQKIKSADIEYFLFQKNYTSTKNEHERKTLYENFIREIDVQKYRGLAEKFVLNISGSN